MANPAKSVALYRVVSAGILWAFPEPLSKPFGLATPPDQPGTFLARIWTSRDVALGAGVLASAGAEQRLWLKIGAVTDAVDMTAAVLAGRSGALSKVGTVACLGASGLALFWGVQALTQKPEPVLTQTQTPSQAPTRVPEPVRP
jgi:hypothetical protein